VGKITFTQIRLLDEGVPMSRMQKSKRIEIVRQSGEVVEVKAYLIDIRPPFQFAVHKSIHPNPAFDERWTVSEVHSTGLVCCGPTRKDTIQEAKKVLAEHPKDVIKRNIESIRAIVEIRKKQWNENQNT